MFDKKAFSEILTKIYNTYSNQRDFADATDVNRAYLSQYINQKLDNPPTPKILMKIAKASKGITTYEELMKVCGHINENDLDSYLLGMLGLTNQDITDFAKNLEQLNLNQHENNIFANIINEIRNATIHKDKTFKLDINKYICNETKETQSKIISALNLYMEYLRKMNNFVSIASGEEDTPEVRAIARDVAKLKPEKKELFKNLLKQMSDEADEANKK